MPKLSIIMPVYNTEKYLDRSISSVINQTFKDWELIIVNDGSSDSSADICSKYAKKDDRIIFVDKENGGPGSARNAGLERASCEYIAFPDSDDWLESDTYEICMKKLEENPVDLLLFGEITEVFDDNSGKVQRSIEDFIEERTYNSQEECRENWSDMIMSFHMNAPWNKIYRKSIIDKYSIRFPDIRRMQDSVFNLRYYDKINSFMSIKEYKYHFIWHSADVQKKKMPVSFLDCAATYHSTAISMLEGWGKKTEKAEIKLGNWFSETLMLAEQTYTPACGNGFISTYRHIKNINNDSYVKNFFARYGSLSTLSKTERAMAHRLNLLLTIIRKMRY